MATNAYVKVTGNDLDPVYLYQHHDGYDLGKAIADALGRGERHGDAPYLARMIFCRMTAGDPMGDTGFSIMANEPDGLCWVVDTDALTVTDPQGVSSPFEAFFAYMLGKRMYGGAGA